MKKVILLLALVFLYSTAYAQALLPNPSLRRQVPNQEFTSTILGFVKFGTTVFPDVQKILAEKKCKQLSWDRPSMGGESGYHSFFCEKLELPGSPVIDFEVDRKDGLIRSVTLLPKSGKDQEDTHSKYKELLEEKYGECYYLGHDNPSLIESKNFYELWIFKNVTITLGSGENVVLQYHWKVPDIEKSNKLKELL